MTMYFRFFFLKQRRPQRSTLFPYTTLFRSEHAVRRGGDHALAGGVDHRAGTDVDRKSTRLNSSHTVISYAVFCLKKKRVHGSLHLKKHPMQHGSPCRAMRLSSCPTRRVTNA